MPALAFDSVRIGGTPAHCEVRLTQEKENSDRRRSVPSVEKLLAAGRGSTDGGHPAMTDAARAVLADERARLSQGEAARPLAELEVALRSHMEERDLRIPTAINATGVILHTNLGRAPWSSAAINAAIDAARGYLLLEIDEETGRRASHRFPLAESYLAQVAGGEDGFATNNNAAALALAVRLAGRGGGVAIARGELVEIGGGVRIPDIIKRAGGRLVEVGTTNKTHLADFEEALSTRAVKLILRVHASNFRMDGFVQRPSRHAMADLAARHGVPIVEDLGSGALLETEAYGLAHEPMPSECLAAGVSLVTFSGDKLVGGPQAGLVVGRRELVDRLRRDPLARTCRLDKVSLAALAATLDAYRRGTATTDVPVWRMIAMPFEAIDLRARGLHERLSPVAPGSVRVAALSSTVGGGSLPGEVLKSAGLAIRTRRISALAGKLRRQRPAVVGRIARGELTLDLRTVDPRDDRALASALSLALGP